MPLFRARHALLIAPFRLVHGLLSVVYKERAHSVREQQIGNGQRIRRDVFPLSISKQHTSVNTTPNVSV